MQREPAGEPNGARYRIAAVSQLTGVPGSTLRAWERRYGNPRPERTDGGYRLYDEADIRVVREMQRLCADGMAASEAARLALSSDAPAPREATAARGAFAFSVEALLAAVERFDDRALDHELRRLMFLGSPTELLDGVLAPVLTWVGDRWHEGKLGVAQEHLATQKIGTVMRDLVRLLPGATATRSVVLACFVDDEHELGLLGTAIRIAEQGRRPIFLGARTPPSAVRSAVAAAAPELVALSLTLTPPRPRARTLLSEYASACGDVPWMAGGAGVGPVADLVEKAGGRAIVGGRTPSDPSLRARATPRPRRRRS
jgi:DNA-binding transcriptional MerR regulator